MVSCRSRQIHVTGVDGQSKRLSSIQSHRFRFGYSTLPGSHTPPTCIRQRRRHTIVYPRWQSQMHSTVCPKAVTQIFVADGNGRAIDKVCTGDSVLTQRSNDVDSLTVSPPVMAAAQALIASSRRIRAHSTTDTLVIIALSPKHTFEPKPFDKGVQQVRGAS